MQQKPNLLFVFADEMQEMAMSCSNNPDVNTPNMDRFAAQGARFTRMYSPDPVCCPARSSLVTGLFPHNTGVTKNDVQMKKDVTCIAELTTAAGYNTGHIGKWHINGPYKGSSYYAFVPPEDRRGFAYWAGFEHGHDYWNGRYYTETDTPIYFAPGVYEPDGQTELALDFIEKNKDTPWHLDLAFGTPHFPLHAKPEDIRCKAVENIHLPPNVPKEFMSEAMHDYRDYYAMIENLDWNFGRLLEKLDELGLQENTIVVFTSDHGDMMMAHGMHYKRRPQEESARIPFLIRWPNGIASEQVVSKPASLVDVMPTLLELMDIPCQDTDGSSRVDLLDPTKERTSPQSVYMEGGFLGCRQYDPEHIEAPWRAVVTERYKACYIKTEENCVSLFYLFDLQNDPYEMKNLAKELGFDEVKEEMKTLFLSWAKQTNDALFCTASVTM